MKTYKRKARREPPPDNRAAYIIKMNTKNAAILKGIAAFFYSTDFYELTFISMYINGVQLIYTDDYVVLYVFSFTQTADKPCFSPGCRSPPNLVFNPSHPDADEDGYFGKNQNQNFGGNYENNLSGLEKSVLQRS